MRSTGFIFLWQKTVSNRDWESFVFCLSFSLRECKVPGVLRWETHL